MSYENIIDLFILKNPFSKETNFHLRNQRYYNVYFNSTRKMTTTTTTAAAAAIQSSPPLRKEIPNINILITISPSSTKTESSYFIENSEINILKNIFN